MWKFIAATLKQGLRQLLENLLEDEVITKVKAQRYERSPQRQGYHGGHYRRDLVTRYGLLENLRVPRLAKGPAQQSKTKSRGSLVTMIYNATMPVR